MRVAHVVASINEETGGPAFSVTQLVAELARRCDQTSIFTHDYEELGSVGSAGDAEIVTRTAGWVQRRFRGHDRGLQALMADRVGEFDVIHNHGLWMFPNLYARRAAVGGAVPLVISPRGMVDRWALRRSPLKKAVAWRLMEQKNFQTAAAFHATSEEEAAALRNCGVQAPIAVIPNGVFVPPRCQHPPREWLANVAPELRAERYVLSLSRLHPKKGLENLIWAWAAVSRSRTYRLAIVGPDLIGYRRRLTGLVEQLGLESNVLFLEPVFGEAKEALLAHAALTVLPSFSENFGVVVAESLAYSVPAVATRATPWRDLESASCGWWIEVGVEPLTHALEEALSADDSVLASMGSRGRDLVERKYNWGAIAAQMLGLYKAVSSGIDVPNDCPI